MALFPEGGLNKAPSSLLNKVIGQLFLKRESPMRNSVTCWNLLNPELSYKKLIHTEADIDFQCGQPDKLSSRGENEISRPLSRAVNN